MILHIINLTDTVHVSDLSFCKHEDLHIAWEKKSIVENILAIGGRFKAIMVSDIVVISESIGKLIHIFKTITETESISESLSGHRMFPRTLTEIITISDSMATRLSKIAPLIIEEILEITERLVANTSGPSWRWRFNPWKKSSMDNELTPDRHYPSIKMPILPTSEQFKSAVFNLKTRLPFIFPFKEDEDDNTQ